MIIAGIAKNLHPGRQEDAHEFLRHLVDAMQLSCLVGTPK
jgi:ubiquitin carboxyl-terminal hydrolase 36/42